MLSHPECSLIIPAGVGVRMGKTERMKVARKYLISGRVQGVGFRFFAEDVANQLGVRGYVKNLWDGRVEVYAIAEQAALEEFKRDLGEGPRAARVTGVEESEEPVNDRYKGFMIEGSW